MTLPPISNADLEYGQLRRGLSRIERAFSANPEPQFSKGCEPRIVLKCLIDATGSAGTPDSWEAATCVPYVCHVRAMDPRDGLCAGEMDTKAKDNKTQENNIQVVFEGDG